MSGPRHASTAIYYEAGVHRPSSTVLAGFWPKKCPLQLVGEFKSARQYATSDGDLWWFDDLGDGSDDTAYSSLTVHPSNGDIYVAGFWSGSTITIGTDTFTGSGGSVCNGASCTDAMVSKMDKDGNVKWAKAWGNAAFSEGATLAVDSSGTPRMCLCTCLLGGGQGVWDRSCELQDIRGNPARKRVYINI